MQAPIQTRPPRQTRLRAGLLLAVASCITTAQAQIIIPANNLGTDGVFNPTSNITIPLGAATTGNWEDAGNGNGIYDAEKWAVVYKFSSVNIPSGVTVRFANHPSGAPVVWLVSGDVVINGSINVSGQNNGQLNQFYSGGPGGFGGGKGQPPLTAGFGPGGGMIATTGFGGGGSFGTSGISAGSSVAGPVYGTSELVPLIGGSGGGSRSTGSWSGSGGGGAILIVSENQILLNGSIVANGGNGPNAASGSGGGIRLVADSLVGSAGTLSAIGGSGGSAGGFGRIRTEANFDALLTNGNPARSRVEVGITARLWPEPGEPMVRVLELGEEPVPADPRALFTFRDTDVEFQSQVPAVIIVEAQNVPLQASVNVRVVPISQNQQSFTVPASFVSGTFASSIWEATLPLGVGVSAFQATVTLP